MLFGVDSGNSTFGKGALIYRKPAGSNFGKGDFHFLQNSTNDTNNPGFGNIVFTIKNNGNVGIGLDNIDPTETLDVDGSIRFRGLLYDSNNDIGNPGKSFRQRQQEQIGFQLLMGATQTSGKRFDSNRGKNLYS